MQITDALERFLVQLRADGRSEHTVAQYQRHVRTLARWLAQEGHDAEVERLDHELLATFLVSPQARTRPDGAKKRETSTNALRSTLRCFFAYLRDAGWVRENPARLVRRARTSPPPPRALSDDEQRRLLDALAGSRTAVERRDRMLFTLLLRTGLRIGSALALRVEDVDLDAGELAIRGKGDQRDRVLVPRDLVPLMREWVEGIGEGWLFAGNGAARLTVRSADRRFEGWAKRAGLRAGATPHALRHSFASGLLRRTGDIALVQRALTHRSILSTTRYLVIHDCRLRAALGA
jgi:integrase/recombinase XerC